MGDAVDTTRFAVFAIPEARHRSPDHREGVRRGHRRPGGGHRREGAAAGEDAPRGGFDLRRDSQATLARLYGAALATGGTLDDRLHLAGADRRGERSGRHRRGEGASFAPQGGDGLSPEGTGGMIALTGGAKTAGVDAGPHHADHDAEGRRSLADRGACGPADRDGLLVRGRRGGMIPPDGPARRMRWPRSS